MSECGGPERNILEVCGGVRNGDSREPTEGAVEGDTVGRVVGGLLPSLVGCGEDLGFILSGWKASGGSEKDSNMI